MSNSNTAKTSKTSTKKRTAQANTKSSKTTVKRNEGRFFFMSFFYNPTRAVERQGGAYIATPKVLKMVDVVKELKKRFNSHSISITNRQEVDSAEFKANKTFVMKHTI